MSYVRKVLLPGERVVYETGLHWLVYGRAILTFLIAAGLAVASGYASSDAQPLVLGLAVLAALVGLVFFIIAGIRRATTELAVTDQRVVFKRGLFARHTVEMNRAKVESVDVDQSLMGRIFGYGTVQLRGTGGSLEPVAAISDPLGFRSHITAEPVRHPVNAD
jgi:uncharacterized membrane protein YdbT with pleckstrin-like domain